MNPHEAHLLLGGYATGTLNEAERKALFAAAMEDQALFDALADEEALRELLADPAARAKLLATLEPPKVRPFWRRPGAMTLTASLIAAVGVGVLLKHTETPELRRMAPPAPAVQEEQAPPQAPASVPAPPEAAKAAPKPAPRLKKQETPPPPPQPAPAPAISGASAAAHDYALVEPKPAAAPPPADQAAGAAAQTQARAPVAGLAGGAMAKRREPSPSPTWSFEGNGAGRTLIVLWGPTGTLALVARAPEGDRAIAPLGESTLPDGRRRSRFAAPEDATPLDLFWTPEALSSYPAKGPVDGFKVRVWPGAEPAH